MSVTGITASLPQFDASPIGGLSRRQAEDRIGRQLEAALQSGDLAAAEQAYNQLSAFGAKGSGPFTDPKLQAQFQTLGQDLQNGDLAAAQNDVGALGQGVMAHDIQAARNAFKNGDSPLDFQNAMANLRGDYFAVFGTMPTNADLSALLSNNSNSPASAVANINVQA